MVAHFFRLGTSLNSKSEGSTFGPRIKKDLQSLMVLMVNPSNIFLPFPLFGVLRDCEVSIHCIASFRVESRLSPQQTDDKLRYHLSQLFPESAVAAVMNAHPDETDPQKLCQRILALQQGFQDSSD
uniref:Uncharacterized protein n=1 Tax=Steinernema glaseri TaxID=37863 RepID=A0A1I7YLK7_9BILA